MPYFIVNCITNEIIETDKTTFSSEYDKADLFIPMQKSNGYNMLYSPSNKIILISDEELIKKNKDIEENARKRLALSKKIGILNFSLTQDCTLNCRYCLYDHKEKETPADMDSILTAIRKLKPSLDNKIQLNFTSDGEQTMQLGKIQSIFDYLAKEGISLKNSSITTNGYFAQEKAEELSRLFDMIIISYDGLPELNDANRITKAGSSGSSGKIIKTIRYLLEKKKEISINTILTKSSLNHREEIIKHMKDLKVKQVQISNLMRIDTSSNQNDALRFSDDIYYSYFYKYYIELEHAFNNLGLAIRQPFCKYIERAPYNTCMIDGLQNTVTINQYGEASLCTYFATKHMQERYRLKESQIYKSIKEDKVGSGLNVDFSIDASKFEECVKCDYSSICFGGCGFFNFATNGNIFQPDKKGCQTQERIYNEFFSIYLEKAFFRKAPFIRRSQDRDYVSFATFEKKINSAEDSCYYIRIRQGLDLGDILKDLLKLNSESSKIMLLIIEIDESICREISPDPGNISQFFRDLNAEGISYILARPIPPFISGRVSKDIKGLPKSLKETPFLYFKDNDGLHYITGESFEIDQSATRDQIYKSFLKSGSSEKSLALPCLDCFKRLRGNCTGSEIYNRKIDIKPYY